MDDIFGNNSQDNAEDNSADLGTQETALAIRFATTGSLDTRCGVAAGVSVAIDDGLGDVKTCTADWAPADANGQRVGDCFFVVHPGTWMVSNVSVVGATGESLSCCSGSYPKSLDVAESTTTEFGASFTCDTVSNGALDIYATVNRPPSIDDVDILPSKFGNTCSLITLRAAGSDPDGDGFDFTWGIMQSPKQGDYAVASRGEVGYFLGTGIGTYTMRLVVADDFQATHHLDFPIHLTGDGGSCDAQEQLEALMPTQ